MYVALSRKQAYQRIGQYWLDYSDDMIVEVLDTTDCVIEKYSLSDFWKLRKTLGDMNKVVYGSQSHNLYIYPIHSIRGGWIQCSNCEVLFNRSHTLTLVKTNIGVVLKYDDIKIAEVNIRVYVRYKGSYIHWAEKLGDFYMVSFMFYIGTAKDTEKQLQLICLFTDTEFIGIYKVDIWWYTLNQEDVHIEKGYEVDGSLHARLRLLGAVC